MPLSLPSLLLAALVAAPAQGPARPPDEPPPAQGQKQGQEQEPEPGSEPQPGAAPQPKPAASGDEARPAPVPPSEQNWLDKTHSFFEARLFVPVIRFDRFFSDEQDLEEERARSFLRWRTELRYDAEATPALSTGVRASLRFPGLNQQLRRLRLVIEGQTREAIGAVFPEERETQGGTRGLGNGDAELRFALFRAVRARGDLGAGVLFSWPPGLFSRARLRWRFNPVDRIITRASLSGFWRTDTRFGTSLDLHLERPFDAPRPMLLRLGSDLLLTEVSRGLAWTPDVTLAVRLGDRVAAALGAAAYWTSDPGPGLPRVDRYKIGLRLRRDFYRRWIFLEVEPEYYWPWSPTEGRHAAWATTFRVEVQFHGVAPPRPAPPAGVPEDDDVDEVDEGVRDVAATPPQR